MTSQSAPEGDGVAVTDRPDQSRYELTVDGERVGLIDYRLTKGTMAMLHAEIDPGHGGRGLGSHMARAALDDARSRHLTVVPMCPFVAHFVEQHADEYADLVA